MASKQVVDGLNGHTLTVVDDSDVVTLRIARNGHNRGIIKLTAEQWQELRESE